MWTRGLGPFDPQTRPRKELTGSCPNPVPLSAFRCHFKVLEGAGAFTVGAGILPCISCGWTAIPVGGDVAEWSKALPC